MNLKYLLIIVMIENASLFIIPEENYKDRKIVELLHTSGEEIKNFAIICMNNRSDLLDAIIPEIFSINRSLTIISDDDMINQTFMRDIDMLIFLMNTKDTVSF